VDIQGREEDMGYSRRYQILPALAVSVLSLVILMGCAAQKPLWGDPDSGLVLYYRMPEAEALEYQYALQDAQVLEAMGQSMITKSKVNMGFSAAAKGQKEENLLLGITVGSLNVDITSPQGNISLDTSSIPGEGFDMTLSPSGKELELSGAAALTYQTGPGSRSSVKSMFDRTFPDLPDEPVEIGATWMSTDDVTNHDNNTTARTVVEIVNVLEGLEIVDGLDCAKIARKLSGTLKGEGSQMGSPFTFDGEIKGTSTVWFAYKEGVLVSSRTNLAGKLNAKSAMGSIPVKTESTEELKLKTPVRSSAPGEAPK